MRPIPILNADAWLVALSVQSCGRYTTAVPLFNEAIELLKVETSIDCSGLISACKSMLSFCKRNLQGQQVCRTLLEFVLFNLSCFKNSGDILANRVSSRISAFFFCMRTFFAAFSFCSSDVAMPDRFREARRPCGVHLGAGTSKMNSQNGSSFALHLLCCHIPSRRGIRKEHATGDKPWHQQILECTRMLKS